MALEAIINRGLTPELIKKAKEELGETDEIRIQGIRELKRLIKGEPDFNPCRDDSFLTRFLRAKKYDVDKAFKTLKNYYTYKAQHSGVFTDLKPSDFLSKFNLIKTSNLEHRDQNHCIIGYSRMGEIDMDDCSPEDAHGFGLLLTELALESEITQIAGSCIIIDFAGFSLGKARRYASPSLQYKIVSSMQDCYPIRIKAFHIVNEPLYINIIYNIMRLFLSEKLKKRFHFHGSNLDSLYNYVDRKILPEELGGEQGPSDTIEKKFFEYMCKHEDYFLRMNKFGYTGKTLQKLRNDIKNAVLN